MDVQEDLRQHSTGDVIPINLTGNGLSVGRDIIDLYLRTACIDLWNYLSAARTDVSIVVGCPGVGKSVEVYAYAMWQAKAVQKRVIYVHSHGDGFSIVSTSGNNMHVGRVKKFVDQPDVLLDFIDEALNRQDVDMIVLDGQLEWLIKSVFLCLKRSNGVRLISCTSLHPFSKLSMEAMAHAPAWSAFEMDSWTLDEYKDAYNKGALVLADDSTTTTSTNVEEMFLYAGGSFRMMQWELSQVIGYSNLQNAVGAHEAVMLMMR